MSARLLLAALASGLVACGARAPAAANPLCPPSEMSLAGSAPFTSTAAVFDSSTTLGDFRVAYDLPAGTAFMRQCCLLATTSVRASDTFDISGVPAGTPVALVVECTVEGAVFTAGCGGTGCSGTFGARLTHGTDADERIHSVHLFNGRADFTDVLRLPITIVAGQPERIDVTLYGHRNPGGSHGSEGSSRIRFTGLDPTLTVVSCQGYAAAPVPVRAATWGRLKVAYR